MKRATQRPLLISAVFAVIGGILTFVVLSQSGASSAPATERVVVAARNVELGQTLTASDVALTEMPKGAAGADTFRNVDEAKGHYASYSFVKGEVVLKSKVSDQPPGSRLAVVIPEGRVAVSVAVSDEISSGGFVAPGDRVDVLGVVTKEAGDTAEVVLRDVSVLAVANVIVGSAEEPKDSKKSASSRPNPTALDATVTLAVTLEEARRLVQVDEVGKLRLALRQRAGDNSLARSP